MSCIVLGARTGMGNSTGKGEGKGKGKANGKSKGRGKGRGKGKGNDKGKSKGNGKGEFRARATVMLRALRRVMIRGKGPQPCRQYQLRWCWLVNLFPFPYHLAQESIVYHCK